MSPGPGRGTPDEKWPEHRPDASSGNQPAEATPDTPGGTPHGAPLTRQGPGKTPADFTPDSGGDTEWQRAEQISEASIVSDDKLASTGSQGLAKQQQDTADQREKSSRSNSAQTASSSRSQPGPVAANPQAGGPPSSAAGIDPREGKTRPANEATGTSGSGHTSGAGRPQGAGGETSPSYPAGKANSKDDLAQTLGFPSFLEFFEGSQSLNSEPNNVWYTTALSGNQWVLWNSQTLEYSRPLPSLEQARQASTNR